MSGGKGHPTRRTGHHPKGDGLGYYLRVICVTGKTGYPSEQLALEKLARIQRANRRRAGTPVRVYHCPSCNGWHLTSRPTWTPR
jgi:hypothetical protein